MVRASSIGVTFFAVDVLDQRDLERFSVVLLGVDERRDFGCASDLGGSPAAIAGDEPEAAARTRSGDDGLQNSSLADRIGQGAERGLIEVFARQVGFGWIS